jgi:fibronectin type 3 domain-containing protein
MSGTGVKHEVDLSWNAPNSSPVPVTGYKVYRATSGSSSFQLLNSSVDTQTSYVDSTVQASTAYTYYVESVDSAGTASGPSNQVSVTVP